MSGTLQRRSTFQRGGGSNGPQEPRQNVAVQILEYNIADPKKRNSDPTKDTVRAVLLHDVPEWGLKAQYAPDGADGSPGAPMTEVIISMPLPANGKGADRRDILGLSKTKGNGPAMDPGSIVVMERAYHAKADAPNVIKAPYAHGCAASSLLNEGLAHVLPNMLVSVRPEGDYLDRDTNQRKPTGRVDVLVADQELAAVVADEADLRSKVEELTKNSGIGNPGFMLLARELAPEGLSEAEKAQFASDPNTRIGGYTVSRRKNVSAEGQEPVYQGDKADELFARFFKDNPDLQQLIGAPNFQVEFVPLMALNQAPSLVPSKVKKGDNVRDNAPLFGLYGPVGAQDTHARNVVTSPSGQQFGMIDVGWQPSHAVVSRMDAESDYWMSTYQRPTKQPSDVLSIHDVVTPLTPDYHKTAIVAVAAENVEAKKSYYAAAKAVEPQPEAAPAPGPR